MRVYKHLADSKEIPCIQVSPETLSVLSHWQGVDLSVSV